MQNSNALALFIHLLLKATHRPYKTGVPGGGVVNLKRGQLITGRKKLAAELRQSEQNIRTGLALLLGLEVLLIDPTSQYSLITIVNYGKYQDKEALVTSELTNGSPTGNQRVTTIQEYKNNKKDKKVPSGQHKDYFYGCFERQHHQKPSPPAHAFINLAKRVKGGLTLEDFKTRCDNYFADPWVSSHSLQGLLSDWDKFITRRSKNERTKGSSFEDSVDIAL